MKDLKTILITLLGLDFLLICKKAICMLSRLFIILFFFTISLHLHAQTDTRAILNQQVEIYKKEFSKKGYSIVREHQKMMNKTNQSTAQLYLMGDYEYAFIAFVDCDFCDLKMHYTTGQSGRKIPIYPKESRNLDISAFSYHFKQKTNSSGQLVTYVNANKKYFGRVLVFRKTN